MVILIIILVGIILWNSYAIYNHKEWLVKHQKALEMLAEELDKLNTR